MNLTQLNRSVEDTHKEEQLLLSSPKEEKVKDVIMDKKDENLKDNKVSDFYSSKDIKEEVKYYKQGNVGPYTSSSTSNSSNSSYSSSYGKYNSNSSNNSKGLYGANNLNYNSRIEKLRKKSKEMAKESKASSTIPFEGKFDFSVKRGKVKKKKKFFKNNKLKQIGIAVATICLEAALGVLVATAKTSVDKIAEEVKNIVSGKGVVANA